MHTFGWRGLRAMLGCALLSAVAGAQEFEQIETGDWINLFDGETLFGWSVIGPDDWGVEDGALTASNGVGSAAMTNSQFQDFELELRVRVSLPGTAGIVVRSPMTGHPLQTGAGMVLVGSPEEGDAEWHDVRVRVVGDNAEATVNGEAVEGFAVNQGIGHIGVVYHAYHGMRQHPATVEVTDVRLRPLRLQSIFNGENLDGWNIIPGRDSIFTVSDGAMNIRDGNGQIETEGVYQNFLLQMEIISHGEHLNSGVFFRGPVGVFWRGYESQVRNQWEGDDRTRPVDFGTGGIYGVQPARKVVSTDHEWFEKTIVANGNYFAVWVDGYQVADMFDFRPVHEGADGKNGFVPDAGTIHLQGHDPGTDLSFRNMHIQEYPEN